ncbi:hypothetical protein [Phenylobacterium ferrooxidans]|uniref:DUF2157 domain-containing protein n=1 Tax=Phenylobacterium ferrooxidans TaxID=2982689 RepID=A0ABW6CVI9_9CAUL
MTRPDDHLAALFANDLPPARDPVFQASVLEAMARRRFQREMVFIAAASLVAAAVLAILWPALQPALHALAQGLAPAGLAIGAAALVVVLASWRPGADLRLR